MESDSKIQAARGGKRAFTKPTLRIYGTVAEITGAINGVSMLDGSGHPKNNMTRPGMNKP